MKKIAVAGSSVLIFMMVAGARAVTWDVDRPLYETPGAVYDVPANNNGGQFYAVPSYFNDNRGSDTKSTDISVPASSTTREEFGSGANPPWMNYQATGGGGILQDGLYNTNFAEITYQLDGKSGVLDGKQWIKTDTYRNFIPDGTGTITVSADITGDFNWEVYNYDWTKGDGDPQGGAVGNPFDWYSGYLMTGVVEVFTVSVIGGPIGSSRQVILDNDTLSGSIEFLVPIVDPDVYYVLHAQLNIKTYMSNIDAMLRVYNLTEEVFKIGDSVDDPLKLTVRLSQGPRMPCDGDLDQDRDVDGKDVFEFIRDDKGVELKRLAGELGRIDCGLPQYATNPYEYPGHLYTRITQ